jgi:hypothetical protein
MSSPPDSEANSLLKLAKTHAGVYTLQEAAHFAQIPEMTLRYWFIGKDKYAAVRQPIIDSYGTIYLTFRDFVEAVAIRYYRSKLKISLKTIREAVVTAREKYNVAYPFSDNRHRLVAGEKNFHIYIEGMGDAVQISGINKWQQSFSSVNASYFKQFRYDNNCQAVEYEAGVFEQKRVILNPRLLLGKPKVENSPCSAPALWRAFREEGDKNRVAQLFRVDLQAVIASCAYCENVRLAA